MYAFESTELKQREIPVCFRESVTLNTSLTIPTSVVLKAIGPPTGVVYETIDMSIEYTTRYLIITGLEAPPY